MLKTFIKFLSTSKISLLFISPCSETEVIQQMYSIKISSSSGYDKISSRFLILAVEVLAIPPKILFNFLFKSGIFPDCLKIAKVIPVYKQGDKTDTDNYRLYPFFHHFSKFLIN